MDKIVSDIQDGSVYIGRAYFHKKSGRVVVTTDYPDEEHNCDAMGCGTDHVLWWGPQYPKDALSPALTQPEETEGDKKLNEHFAPASSLREQGEGWISVKERLPEQMGHYIVRMADEPEMGPRTDIAFYAIRGPGSMAVEETGWCQTYLYGWANQEVTHWMPLPKPPALRPRDEGVERE
jgi:hypothetical protein